MSENRLIMKLGQPVHRDGDPGQWPTPPAHLMEYGEDPNAHLQGGRWDFESVLSACEAYNVYPLSGRRMLDFGCSNGRVTRWFSRPGAEVWGCDIQAAKVLWAQENLGPPLRFFVNSVEASLPVPDGYFDFVLSQSIFTHLNDSHIAWLMELCRAVRPGGHLYLTVHDRHSLDLNSTPKAHLLFEHHFNGIEEYVADISTLGFLSMNAYPALGNLSQIYMSEEYFRRILPPWAELIGIVPRAYSELQSGYIVRRK